MSLVVSVFVILGSAVAVATGLVALTRAVFRAAVDLRDNKNATIANTRALKDLASHVNGRIESVEEWIRQRDPKWRRLP